MSYHYKIDCDGCGETDPTWDSVPDTWVQVTRDGTQPHHYCDECWDFMLDALEGK